MNSYNEPLILNLFLSITPLLKLCNNARRAVDGKKCFREQYEVRAVETRVSGIWLFKSPYPSPALVKPSEIKTIN